MNSVVTTPAPVQYELLWPECPEHTGALVINGQDYTYRTGPGAAEFGVRAFLDLAKPPQVVKPGDPAFYRLCLLEDGRLDCDCAAYSYRPERGPCKHQQAVAGLGLLDRRGA